MIFTPGSQDVFISASTDPLISTVPSIVTSQTFDSRCVSGDGRHLMFTAADLVFLKEALLERLYATRYGSYRDVKADIRVDVPADVSMWTGVPSLTDDSVIPSWNDIAVLSRMLTDNVTGLLIADYPRQGQWSTSWFSNTGTFVDGTHDISRYTGRWLTSEIRQDADWTKLYSSNDDAMAHFLTTSGAYADLARRDGRDSRMTYVDLLWRTFQVVRRMTRTKTASRAVMFGKDNDAAGGLVLQATLPRTDLVLAEGSQDNGSTERIYTADVGDAQDLTLLHTTSSRLVARKFEVESITVSEGTFKDTTIPYATAAYLACPYRVNAQGVSKGIHWKLHSLPVSSGGSRMAEVSASSLPGLIMSDFSELQSMYDFSVALNGPTSDIDFSFSDVVILFDHLFPARTYSSWDGNLPS